jgi:lipid-A-disaccharide synthase
MQKSKHIVIIAGEESGDLHASILVKQLKKTYPEIKISGIGGKHMQTAGAALISDLARFGVTGFTEILRHLKVIRKAFKAIKKHLSTQKPDLLILVDYPGFNLRLAKYAKRVLGLKIIYYISPQIWAWKAQRIRLIKECVDVMAVILPFEKKIYEHARVPVRFVGHPLVEKISTIGDKQSQRARLNLPLDAKIIALLPGSRNNEIEQHMPVLRDTAKLLLQHMSYLKFVIPIAGTINTKKVRDYFLKSDLPIHFIEGQALQCMAASDFVIVASGTASLECALLQKPMCIIYKSSFLTYVLAAKLIKVKFLGLCNLLSNKMMVPEFLQYDCNPQELSKYIIQFFNDETQSANMLARLAALKCLLSEEESDGSLFSLIESQLFEKNALF